MITFVFQAAGSPTSDVGFEADKVVDQVDQANGRPSTAGPPNDAEFHNEEAKRLGRGRLGMTWIVNLILCLVHFFLNYSVLNYSELFTQFPEVP